MKVKVHKTDKVRHELSGQDVPARLDQNQTLAACCRCGCAAQSSELTLFHRPQASWKRVLEEPSGGAVTVSVWCPVRKLFCARFRTTVEPLKCVRTRSKGKMVPPKGSAHLPRNFKNLITQNLLIKHGSPAVGHDGWCVLDCCFLLLDFYLCHFASTWIKLCFYGVCLLNKNNLNGFYLIECLLKENWGLWYGSES